MSWKKKTFCYLGEHHVIPISRVTKLITKLNLKNLNFINANSISVVHEYIGIHGCSYTDEVRAVNGEDMHGVDNEEVWHADYSLKTGVLSLPDFGDPMTFPGFYEKSVIEMTGCKSDVVSLTKIFNSPPPEMGKA